MKFHKGHSIVTDDLILPDSRHLQDVPLNGHVELGQVHTHFHDIGTRLLVHVAQIDL